jgi:hypothetical protein
MPNIRDISLFLGRSSHSKEEFVRISFNVDFTPSEQSLEAGFIMHVLLISVNDEIDDFEATPSGIIRRRTLEEADNILGSVYHDVINPGSNTIRVDRTKAWDFGTLREGPEEYRALIAIIPKSWELSPAVAQSGPVRIDLG